MKLSHVRSLQPDGHSASSIPHTKEDRDAIMAQLDRLLSSPLFNQSRRYSNLLRHIVLETLEGRADHLKERTLGVAVFHRHPAYDTAADPVVRTTAAQLRRRIAQYYFEPGHDAELVIELPPGGYTPEFRPAPKPELENLPRFAPPDAIHQVPVQPTAPPETGMLFSRRWLLVFAAALTLAVCGALTFSRMRAAPARSTLDKFWNPVLDSTGSVLLCVGYSRRDSQINVPAPTISDSLRANSVAWPDAITATGLASLILSRGRSYHLRKSGMTAFSDLRESPAVLVGGFNNEWIMRLGTSLRFRYRHDPETRLGWIEDQQNPSRKDWGTNFGAPFSTFDKDYGVITRVLDPTTERLTVIASGIASYGTIAAGEFLTNQRYMEMVEPRAPKGWERKNMQVVFSTNVINGNSGPPQILATYFW